MDLITMPILETESKSVDPCSRNKTDETRNNNPPSSPQKGIRLRDYQVAMVNQTYRHINAGIQRILLTVIMGAGKTYTAAWILRDCVTRGHRCIFLVSLNVLLDQTAESLRELGVDCTVLQGNRAVDPGAPVIIASAQTISARVQRGASLESLLGTPRLIITDEAHNTSFLSIYEQIEACYSAGQTIFIGLTATPWRLSKKEWLGQRFDVLVEGPQPPEIVQRSGAVPCRGFTLTGAFDLEELRVRRGDYVDSDIATQACKPEALNHVVVEWLRICSGRPTLMVGATVEQARQTDRAFNDSGIAAETIVGSTPQAERAAIFERVKQGQTLVICSVGCLTAGFNLPAIAAILYVRATKSKALFHQTAGRGSRPYSGKVDYLLLDFGGNLKRHGNPMGYQVYDISEPDHEPPESLTKTCPECSAEVNVFSQVCPICGFEFSGNEPEEDEQQDLVLQSLNEYVDRFTKRKIANLRRWRKAAYKAGESPDKPIERFNNEYGHIPPAEWLLNACLGKRVSQKRKLGFLDYLENHCQQGGKWADRWIRHHLQLEFGTADLQQLDFFSQWTEILEIPYTAAWDEVKAAYLRKVRDLPDGHPQHETAALALQDARADLFTSEAQEVTA